MSDSLFMVLRANALMMLSCVPFSPRCVTYLSPSRLSFFTMR
ncbi:hypothetical protein [Pectobacterium cacticida]